MVLPVLVSLKNLIKTKEYHIDLPFFRLHYQATVCLLLAFSVILTAKVLFGETIRCIGNLPPAGDSKFMDNICYAIGTYTMYAVQNHTKQSHLANATLLVDPNSTYLFTGVPLNPTKYLNVKVYWHTYYQYVPLILFVQAVLFYFPHYLWKLWENGVISSICKRLHEHRFAPNEYFDSNYDMIYYIQNVLKFNKSLVYKYYFCHVLCLFNLVIQIIVLDMIFNYHFVTYGYVFIQYMFFNKDMYGLHPNNLNKTQRYQQTNLNSPMDLIFPKVSGCLYELSSKSGTDANQYESMCVLPLNILHDKFFLILWFWFLILLVLTVVQVINDFMFTMLPIFRRYLFAKRFGASLFNVGPDDSCSRPPASLQELFLLNIVGHNTDKFALSALLRRLEKTDGLQDWTASPSENQSVL